MQHRLLVGAHEVLRASGGDSILRGIYTQVGAPSAVEGMVNIGSAATGAHLTNVSVYLVPIDQRQITAEDFVSQGTTRCGRFPVSSP